MACDGWCPVGQSVYYLRKKEMNHIRLHYKIGVVVIGPFWTWYWCARDDTELVLCLG